MYARVSVPCKTRMPSCSGVGAVDQGLADVPVEHGLFGIGLQGLFGKLGIGNEAVGAGLHADGAAGVEDEDFLHIGFAGKEGGTGEAT